MPTYVVNMYYKFSNFVAKRIRIHAYSAFDLYATQNCGTKNPYIELIIKQNVSNLRTYVVKIYYHIADFVVKRI